MASWTEAQQALAQGKRLISGLSENPGVFSAATQMLDLLNILLPQAEGQRKGAQATALIAALSVLFEEDHSGGDWKAMLSTLGHVPNRPMSRKDLADLGGPHVQEPVN